MQQPPGAVTALFKAELDPGGIQTPPSVPAIQALSATWRDQASVYVFQCKAWRIQVALIPLWVPSVAGWPGPEAHAVTLETRAKTLNYH